MNQMPGFTAEASLYQSSSFHQMTRDVVSHGSGKGVIPQARIILDGFCIGNGSYCCFKVNGKWWCGRSSQT
jgi:hypothetical protein